MYTNAAMTIRDEMILMCKNVGREEEGSNWVITTWLCIRKTRPRIAMGKRPTNVSTFISNVTL